MAGSQFKEAEHGATDHLSTDGDTRELSATRQQRPQTPPGLGVPGQPASVMATGRMEDLDLSDAESEDAFASPSKTRAQTAESSRGAGQHGPRNGESRFDAEQAREAGLQKELDGVRNINEVIGGLLTSLERAKSNMGTVSQTVTNASTLLQTWTQILSQTEHNQRLILNPHWRGATQDVVDMENEVVLQAQAAERRTAEEERRREEARRKAEQEEQQRQAGTTTRGSRGTRSRGRGIGRGASSTSTNYMGPGGQSGSLGNSRAGSSSSSSSRAGSGIGRGLGTARGRARGIR